MAKEGLFNILNNRYFFEDLSVLDLFAGTGNMSFEFASRGTPNIMAVDAHISCVRFIEKISKELDFPIDTIKSDVFRFLERNKVQYDLIFADPPYDMEETNFQKIPRLVFENDLLTEDGLLIIEHAPQTDLSQEKNFEHLRKYGSSVFSFFKNQ